MKEILGKTSTTSIVAVLIILCGFSLLFFMAATELPKDNTRAVQLYTGTFALMGIAAAYYFSATKTRPPYSGGTPITNADTVTVNNSNSTQEDEIK